VTGTMVISIAMRTNWLQGDDGLEMMGSSGEYSKDDLSNYVLLEKNKKNMSKHWRGCMVCGCTLTNNIISGSVQAAAYDCLKTDQSQICNILCRFFSCLFTIMMLVSNM
jgi:hypothetical protein